MEEDDEEEDEEVAAVVENGYCVVLRNWVDCAVVALVVELFVGNIGGSEVEVDTVENILMS